jgi:hypothetical protein
MSRLLTLLAITAIIIAALISPNAPALAAQGSGDGSSRETPIALGQSGIVGDYDVTVLDSTPNANEIVATEDDFNAPPLAGNQFFIARLAVTRTAATPGTPWIDLNFQAVGASGVGYSMYLDSCGLIPDDALLVPELGSGTTVEFNVCWQIASTDATSLVMYVDRIIASGEGTMWFALTEGGAAASGTPAGAATPEVASSQDAPLPVGATGVVGSLQVTVTAVTLDAGSEIMAAYPYNDPPASGNQFVMVTVTVTNTGSTPVTPWMALSFQALADSGTSYNEYDNGCGIIPNAAMNSGDLFAGGTATFNVCWQVPSADAESLVMFVDPLTTPDDSARAWFSLKP